MDGDRCISSMNDKLQVNVLSCSFNESQNNIYTFNDLLWCKFKMSFVTIMCIYQCSIWANLTIHCQNFN